MKNVLLKTSLLMNCVSMAFVAKLWSPITEFKNSHHETPLKMAIHEQKSDIAKVFLKQAMLSQRTEIENCYDNYLRREPRKVDGSVAVRWSISGEGQVVSPSIADSQIDDNELKDCILDQVSMMTFNPAKFGENMQFSYRFYFKARAPGSINFR